MDLFGFNNKPRRKVISKGIGRLVLQRQGFACAKCRISFKHVHWHYDHKIPLSKGGTNVPSNIQALCPNCHQSKTSSENRKRSTESNQIDGVQKIYDNILGTSTKPKKRKNQDPFDFSNILG